MNMVSMVKFWTGFKSCLNKREQFTSINNTHSDKKNISCGIPQGSILGPLLFLIYINDLPNVLKKLYSILFANDTNVFLKGNNLNSLSTIINEELNKLSIWLASNKLTLNIEKSHYVIFQRARLKQSNMNISLKNSWVLLLVKNYLLQGTSHILKLKFLKQWE